MKDGWVKKIRAGKQNEKETSYGTARRKMGRAGIGSSGWNEKRDGIGSTRATRREDATRFSWDGG